MINMTENGRFLGPAWWILQVLRVCNIIALLSVAVASVVLVIKTDVKNSFFFFEAFSHLVTAGVALMLIVSELPQPRVIRDFFRSNWPTFSTVDACNRGHSLAWLGVWMISMGTWVMGSLHGDNLVEKLSLPLWRLTLGAGILALVFGFFNFIVSVLFRNGTHGITARMVREHGANVYNVRTTMMPPDYDLDASTLNGSARSNSVRKEKHHANAGNRFTYNFSQGFQNNRITRMFGKDKKPQISAPISAPVMAERDIEAQYPDHHDHHNHQENVVIRPVSPVSPGPTRESWEASDRASPIAPNVQRPPTALHPAYTGKARTYRSSIYSTASYLTRF
ncbi:hypothetical protein J7T55_006239 [Diaporthe amygdali]|uniref:uncharacterized protein n=1 Tax=Phomopsis amygdali TaxID=1214568 RepID=UPI0022FE878A|nr:uncharacterized protein J7T55_006239 [Diaporthe amygdali]KAJ0124896.1 hypothetical protein J7T55_006239 [Diaporthe amygdali]